jgi:hypothetical protein
MHIHTIMRAHQYSHEGAQMGPIAPARVTGLVQTGIFEIHRALWYLVGLLDLVKLAKSAMLVLHIRVARAIPIR